MSKKIAVVAGTPVDTQMGIDCLKSRNSEMETIFLPLEDNPRACHVFQMKSEDEKYAQMKVHFQKGIDLGASIFFIYCNSLSASFDFAPLSKELDVACITPLDAYKKIANKYDCCGLIAANNQATAGIEKALTLENNGCYVLGSGLLLLVEDIERGFRNEGHLYLPEAIVERHQLKKLCEFYKENGAKCLILGCTHFPYLRKALEDITDLPVIDPADIMYEITLSAYHS